MHGAPPSMTRDDRPAIRQPDKGCRQDVRVRVMRVDHVNPFTPDGPEDQDLSDRLPEIVDQILRIFDPGRDPHETIGQTDLGAPVGRNRRMRHRRWM